MLNAKYDLIVFSHLRWEFVYQRPQHILERLSKESKVLFIEEPIEFNDENYGSVNCIKINNSITVLQPRIENNLEKLAVIVEKYAAQLKMKNTILWFYSAAFQKITNYMQHLMIVYDCMDELSAFKGASAELISEERELLAKANVVFTGGKSLYEAKKHISKNVYCFPSSVDKTHFAKSLTEIPLPQELLAIRKPIVGYFGVIDERIDLILLEKVAEQRPDVTFVMIGPIAKIDKKDLPIAKNIIFSGIKPYDELPRYLKSFDIAMMPFALNDATRFISPTKTLEYMAGLKPIISTAIYDVVRDYQHVLKIVNTPDQFISAIDEYLLESEEFQRERQQLQNAIVNQTSWDYTVKAMKDIIYKSTSPLINL